MSIDRIGETDSNLNGRMNDWNFWIKALHSAAIDTWVQAVEPEKPELGLTRRESSLAGIHPDLAVQMAEVAVGGRIGVVVLAASRPAIGLLKMGIREALEHILKNLIDQEARVRGVDPAHYPRISKVQSGDAIRERPCQQAVRFPFKVGGHVLELWIAL